MLKNPFIYKRKSYLRINNLSSQTNYFVSFIIVKKRFYLVANEQADSVSSADKQINPKRGKVRQIHNAHMNATNFILLSVT